MTAPKFDLLSAINDFIRLRDGMWKTLSLQDEPLPADLLWLETVNNVVREMAQLKPGPTTPVLSHDNARAALLTVSVCAVFIARCRCGLPAGALRTEEGHRNSAAPVHEVMLPHALRAIGEVAGGKLQSYGG